MSKTFGARQTAALLLVANLALAATPTPLKPTSFAGSDARRIEAQELLELDGDQLQAAINEIYARACHPFKDPALAARFRDVGRGCTHGAERALTPVEQSNVTLLKRFQTYLIEYPDGFEATYSVADSVGPEGVAVRDCPNAECKVVGLLAAGCSVNGDFRMDEVRGKAEWVFVRSSQCRGARGPGGGYVPRLALHLVAG